MLALHEVGMEIVLHPEFRSVLKADVIVEARLKEEQEEKQMLTRLEALDVDSPEFNRLFLNLQTSVVQHAEAVERDELDRLEAALDSDRLDVLRSRFQMVQAVGPTHPHPAVGESATANLLTGPFTAMVDRIRDAATQASRK
jgi:hypothetical protein